MQKFRFLSSWQWILAIFTLASLVETIFYSQMLAFTPLYLPELGLMALVIAYRQQVVE